MADPVRGDAERYQARFRAHGLIGQPPGQPPAPLLPGQAGRDRHVTGTVIGDKTDEGVRPAQRAVDACLAGTRQRRQDHIITGTTDQLRDRGPPAVPVHQGQRRPGRFRCEIHPGRQHRTTLRSPANLDFRSGKSR